MMTLRVSGLQSDSDLESNRNSCDVFFWKSRVGGCFILTTPLAWSKWYNLLSWETEIVMIQFHSESFLRRAMISGGSWYVLIVEQQSSVDMERDNMLCSNTFIGSDAVSMAVHFAQKWDQFCCFLSLSFATVGILRHITQCCEIRPINSFDSSQRFPFHSWTQI